MSVPNRLTTMGPTKITTGLVKAGLAKASLAKAGLAIMMVASITTNAAAWEAGDKALIEDRVQTMTVIDKSWGIGGVAVDQIGSVYVADFAETVWKVTPDGEVLPFATGLYGASGNAFDNRGNLFQSNFSANTVSKIDRLGNVTPFATEGLAGPVGIAIAPDNTLYVCNCRNNSISRITPNGDVSELASLVGSLSGCPNGITFGPDETLYVVGFGRSVVLKISLDGKVETLTEIPDSWLGHLVFANRHLYVTSFGTHQIYRVGLDGSVSAFAGSHHRGIAGGAPAAARFSNPNGIAVTPGGGTLYVNSLDVEWGLPTRGQPPAPLVLSRIELPTLLERMAAALETSGIEAATAAYHTYTNDPLRAGENNLRAINFFGYRLLITQRNPDAAVAVFELNTEAHPETASVWDSLADGHRARGELDLAAKFYAKSLELDPDNAQTRQKLESIPSAE